MSDDATTAVDLTTDVGECRAAAFFVGPDESDEAIVAALGIEDLCLGHVDGAVVLIYLLEDALEASWMSEVGIHDASISNVPLPDGVTWKLSRDSAERALAALDGPEETPAATGEPYNDALIWGELDGDLLTHQIKVAFGQNRQHKVWTAVDTTVGALVNELSQHKVGPKDGRAFIQGAAVAPKDSKSGNRHAKSMTELHLFGIDVDCGVAVVEVFSRLQKLGLLSVIYTTHSHLKTTSDIPESAYLKWSKKAGVEGAPTVEHFRRFLVEARRVLPAVADTVSEYHRTHTADGMQYVLTHAPIEKFRVVCFLEKAFVPADAAPNQDEALKIWRGKLLGFGQMLDLPIDSSCLDASRLFYLPRHAEGRAHETHVLAGRLLNLDLVPTVDERTDLSDRDVFALAAEDMASGGPIEFQGVNLRAWAAQRGAGFQIASLFEARSEDQIIERQSSDKVTVRCPYAFEHSHTGDDDMGCYVVNGEGEGVGNGFVFRCRHNACADRDRLTLLKGALEADYFSVEDLADDTFQILTLEAVEERQEAAAEPTADRESERIRLLSAAQALDQHATEMQIADICRRIGIADFDDLVVDNFVKTLRQRTGNRAETLRREINRHRPRRAPERADDSNLRTMIEGQIEQLGLESLPVFTKGDFTTAVWFDDGRRDVTLKNQIAAKFSEFNGIWPTCYNYGRVKVALTLLDSEVTDVNGHTIVEPAKRYTMKELNPHAMANILEKCGRMYKPAEEGGICEEMLPEKWLKQILDKDECFHTLDGYSNIPYFTPTGRLITTPGYCAESRLYLKPSETIDFPSPEAIPMEPSDDDVRWSLELIEDIWGEFPFDDDNEATGGICSWANFLAYLITPFVRPMIGNNLVPFFDFTKPDPGTGASLLIETSLMVSQAEEAPRTQNYSRDNEEIKKLITSAFLGGLTNLWFDNIPTTVKVDHAALANLATSVTWSDRVLGGSSTADFPNRMVCIVSGNNVRASSEIMRRFLPIRLDAKRNPLTRTGFKYPDLRLTVKENRTDLMMAILILIQNWIAKDMPHPVKLQGLAMPSFERFRYIVGGVLECAGVEGFMGNLHLTLGEADEDARAWAAFAFEWWSAKGNEPLRAAELAEIYCGMPDQPNLGFRPIDDVTQATVKLSQVLGTKKGSIIELKLEDGIQEMVIHRVPGPSNSGYRYILDKNNKV